MGPRLSRSLCFPPPLAPGKIGNALYFATMLLMALVLLNSYPTADLIVENGRIWTDGHLTRFTSVAVKDGKFEAIGKSLSQYDGPSTKHINARGNWIGPGIIDSHTHIAEECVSFVSSLDLHAAKSKEEFIQLVRDQTAKLTPTQWITGSGWSAESYPEKEVPSKEWIDPVTGGHPAILSRMDGHSVLLNSAALRAAGITKDGPPDPPGGRIERDPITHDPTGIIEEGALRLVHPPVPDAATADAALMATIAEAHRYGVTASSDIVNVLAIGSWQRYMKRPDRNFRVALYLRASMPQSVEVVAKLPGIEGWMEPRGIKLFMDGSLGSRTAYMAKPFTTPLPSQPKDWRGIPRTGVADGTYKKVIAAAAKSNIQVITHAIGDQANHDILDLYAELPDIKKRRFRVEHAQHLEPQDIPRFSQLGVIASMQPFHKADDGLYAEKVIGTERCKSSYAYRDILRTGGTLAFGSDFDVVTINPWVGMETAVTGRISTGKSWMTHENITLDQALDAYTRQAAYSMFMENEIGRIAPSYRADFVILDRRLKADGSNVGSTRPAFVFVEGKELAN